MVVSPDGVLVDVGPSTGSPVGQLVEGAWVGPALVDAHVHLAVASPDDIVHLGVGAVRDLGAPLLHAQEWRAGVGPVVAVAGELITAPGGYPMNSWGADGFGWPVRDAADASAAVRRLVEGGVDLVKLALEPADGQPVPDLPTCRALVDAAHAAGLAVTCHALNALMVTRALDAGVDELCHTPTEPLASELIERIAASGVPVVSTLQTHVDGGAGAGAISNAHALVAAGVAMVYGTDLGNTGTAPGPSSAELELLAEAGLGREGALRAATSGAAAAAGLTGRVDVTVAVGARTVLVVLTDDPLLDPTAWHRPVAVVAGGRVVGGSASTDSAFEGPR